MRNAIHRLGVGLAGVALSAFVVLAFAAPSAAKIVEFNSLLKAGLGDGGNPPTTTSIQPNGLPLCSKGLVTHLNNSGVGHGFVEVSSGSAPQSIMAVRPFKYGSPGPLGPGPTFSMPGQPGDNGGARVESSTCMLAFPPALLPAVLNARTQSTSGNWPAEYTFHLTTLMTMMGGTATRNVQGTAQTAHLLAAGNGPGNFSVSVNSTFTQFLSGIAGSNTFGGGFRATGGGRVNLNVNLAPGVSATGYWLSGPRIVGHNRTKNPATTPVTPGNAITQNATQSGTFTTNVGAAMIPVLLRVWNMPFTTGMVHAEDHGGQFVTIRDLTGTDARTSMGEMGTLLLVSPWTANLQTLNLYFGGTVDLKFTFLPEPGPTALFAAGVLGIFALHFAIRRRK